MGSSQTVTAGALSLGEGEGRALVLGASSLIGRRLLPRLADPLRPAAAISRRPRANEPGVEWLCGDLADPAAVRWPEGIDRVYVLCPIWLLPPLAEPLAGAGARRVLAFSSTSRFTKAASPLAEERRVAEALARGEEEALAAFSRLGVPLTILRPTLIYDEGRDGNVSRLAALIRRLGFLPLSGEGAGRRQPVHAEDLAEAAVRAAASAVTEMRTYDVPGGETLAYREMAARIFEGLGRRPRLLSLPPALWAMAFALVGPLLPGASAAMGARMSEDLVFDGAPAARDFGWSPRPFKPRFSSASRPTARVFNPRSGR